MTYFWTIQEHVPDGLGFRLFGIAHLLWLGGIVLAVLAIALTCRRWKPETVHRLLCGLTWAALLLEICKDGVLLYTGQFRPNYLPLDLCGLSIFVEFAAVRSPRPLLLEPVYSLSLPGACLALLFPNWFSLPLWNFFSLHSFLLHGLLVLVPAGSISQELRTTALAMTLLTLGMGNVAFALYDRALCNLLLLYKLKWQPKLHKMLGMH